MTALRSLALVFFLMAGYGLGADKHGPMLMSLGMVAFILWAETVFKRQDAEHEKYVRIKRSLLLTSEHMMELHGCEASAPCVYNPATGMQVAD